MRITKKFAGDASIGKQLYKEVTVSAKNRAEVQKNQSELKQSEKRFIMQLNQKSAKSGSPSIQQRYPQYPYSPPTMRCNPPSMKFNNGNGIPSPPSTGQWKWVPYMGAATPSFGRGTIAPAPITCVSPMHGIPNTPLPHSAPPIRTNGKIIMGRPVQSYLPMPMKMDPSVKRAKSKTTQKRSRSMMDANEKVTLERKLKKKSRSNSKTENGDSKNTSDCNLLLGFIAAVRDQYERDEDSGSLFEEGHGRNFTEEENNQACSFPSVDHERTKCTLKEHQAYIALDENVSSGLEISVSSSPHSVSELSTVDENDQYLRGVITCS